MNPSREPGRRRFLAGACGVASLVAGAGCLGDGPSADGDGTNGTDGAGDGDGAGAETDDTDDTGADDDDAELDLREANVVDVVVDGESGRYGFDVTLHHDDGEDGYANWWQVERLDGSRLGRRELLHAHSSEPFTRSETVEVPDGADCVVVRGHDQTHGYGGRAALVDVASGAFRSVDQGPEPDAFDADDCH